MKLNGQTIMNAKEQINTLCVRRHNQLVHVHYNGGLNIPEGTPTYCGFNEYQCGKFRKRTYQMNELAHTELDRKFKRVINLFATIEILFDYPLPSGFCDEFLASVKDLKDYVDNAIETENG